MKKVKVLVSFIVLLTFFGGVNAVKADGLKNRQYSNKSMPPVGNLGIKVEGETIDVYNYSFDGNTAYCMDPHKVSGNVYKVDRVLTTELSDIVRFHDVGIAKILELGYRKGTNDTYNNCTILGGSADCSVRGNEFYLATSIAVRAFSLGLFGFGENPTYQGGKNLASAHINEGSHWASLYSEYANEVLGTNCSDEECFTKRLSYKWINNSKFSYGEEGSTSFKVIYAAQRLYYEGLMAAYNYKTDSVKLGEVKAFAKSNTSNENGVEYINQQISINNLVKNGSYLKNFTWSCPNCDSNGVTFQKLEYSLDGSNWNTLNADKNILDDINDTNGYINANVYLRAVVNKNNTNNSSCKTIEYLIRYNYFDANQKYRGVLLKDSSMTGTQRFFMLVTDTDYEITGKISCSGDTPCEAMIKNPVCDKDTTKDVGSYSIEDIKKCVIDKTDEAGNSYEAYKYTVNNESHGGLIAYGEEENPYCSVYCKEDYDEIKLSPIIQGANCGRDFKLTSHIKGTKSCYVGSTNTNDKSIDKKKFRDDIIQLQKDMINSYNEWAMASSAINNIQPIVQCAYNEKGVGGCAIVGYFATYNATIYNYTNPDGNSFSLTINGKNDSGQYGSDSSLEGLKNSIQRTINQAKENAEGAYNKFVKALSNYNACTTGWDNYYQFDQKLRFYYNELQGYTNTVESAFYQKLRPEDTYLNPVKSKDEVNGKAIEKVMVCSGSVDNNYEKCSTNWVEYDFNIDNNAKWGDNNYNSNYEGIFSDVSFAVAVPSGSGLQMSNNKYKVSKANFVKKTVTKEQDYESPTTFYQDSYNGAIIVDKDIATKFGFTTLYNRLPISQKNTGGGQYKLFIEGLGEFYNTGETGRIYDFENTGKISMNNPPAYKTNTVGYYYKDKETTFDGSYSCSYQNYCLPDTDIPGNPGCPRCVPECVGDGCHWEACPTCVPSINIGAFDEGKVDVTSKTISTTNVKGAKRAYGYNWIRTSDLNNIVLPDGYSTDVLRIIAAKADATIDEIETINDTIYKNNGESNGLAFSIKMTQSVINKLKDYNKSHAEDGGYANNSLTCFDYTYNNHTYKNIFCLSEVIDLLIDSGADITGIENRPSDNRTWNGYWTPWTLKVDGISNDFVFGQIDGNTNKIIGGPSWK